MTIDRKMIQRGRVQARSQNRFGFKYEYDYSDKLGFGSRGTTDIKGYYTRKEAEDAARQMMLKNGIKKCFDVFEYEESK